MIQYNGLNQKNLWIWFDVPQRLPAEYLADRV